MMTLKRLFPTEYPGNGVVTFAIVAALISLVLAVWVRSQNAKPGAEQKRLLAYILVGMWALLPPIWFGIEFTVWMPSKDNLDFFKHGQDIARNIWVAFVIVLGTITGIKWKE